MFEHFLSYVFLSGNIVATTILFLNFIELKKTTIKTIQDKRTELIEHREKLRGDILEVCENMWSQPDEWRLLWNGAMHRSGLTVETIRGESIYIVSPIPDHDLNVHEQRELLNGLRHIQGTQMRDFLTGERTAGYLEPPDGEPDIVGELTAGEEQAPSHELTAH